MSVVLITGASRGIGKACALKYASENHRVILVARPSCDFDDVLAEVRSLSPKSQAFGADLNNSKEIDELFAFIRKDIGGLDIAINNAGTEGAMGEIQTQKLEDFDHTLNLNLRSLWYSIKLECEIMQKQKKGSIVNIASIAGHIGIPSSALYCASKHAVLGLTKSLALEQAAYGIRINSISPGTTATNMLSRIYQGDLKSAAAGQLLKRLATPEEIAEATYFLASEKCEYMLGTDMIIDGGYTAK